MCSFKLPIQPKGCRCYVNKKTGYKIDSIECMKSLNAKFDCFKYSKPQKDSLLTICGSNCLYPFSEKSWQHTWFYDFQRATFSMFDDSVATKACLAAYKIDKCSITIAFPGKSVKCLPSYLEDNSISLLSII